MNITDKTPTFSLAIWGVYGVLRLQLLLIPPLLLRYPPALSPLGPHKVLLWSPTGHDLVLYPQNPWPLTKVYPILKGASLGFLLGPEGQCLTLGSQVTSKCPGMLGLEESTRAA